MEHWCVFIHIQIKKNIRIFSMFKGHVIFKRIHTPPFSVVSLCLVLFVKKTKQIQPLVVNQLPFLFRISKTKYLKEKNNWIKNEKNTNHQNELCWMNKGLDVCIKMSIDVHVSDLKSRTKNGLLITNNMIQKRPFFSILLLKF